MTFRTPGVGGDILLLVLLLPLATASLAFLLLIPIVGIAVAAGIEPRQDVVAWLSIGPAVAIMLIFIRRKLFWTLTLGDDALLLGRRLSRRVPYDRIQFLLSGSLANPMVVVGANRAGLVPLALSTGPLRNERIFLTRNDADRCLRAIHARAPRASAVDFNGRTYGPREGVAVPYATYRLAESLLIRALVAFAVVGAAVVSVVALIASRQSIAAIVDWWPILAVAPALAAYGVRNVRRTRRALRGEFDQSRL